MSVILQRVRNRTTYLGGTRWYCRETIACRAYGSMGTASVTSAAAFAGLGGGAQLHAHANRFAFMIVYPRCDSLQCLACASKNVGRVAQWKASAQWSWQGRCGLVHRHSPKWPVRGEAWIHTEYFVLSGQILS